MVDRSLSLISRSTKVMQFLFGRIIVPPKQHIWGEIRFKSTRIQNKLIKKSNGKQGAHSAWKVTVVCAGEDGTANTVLLDTPTVGYLFNCGEMTQRCLLNNHLASRFNLINHIFLTSTSFRNIGGILGYCLSTRWRGSDKPFIIHGHKNNENVFKLLQLFTEIRILKVLNAEWRKPNHNYFEDGHVIVQYVKLLPKSNKSTELSLNQGIERNISEEENYAVAYIVRRKTDTDKSSSKKITKNLLSEISQGTTKENPSKDRLLGCGETFLVLECPSEDYLDSVLSSHQLKALAAHQENMPSLIVHMSPASVIADDRYKEFMSWFSTQTYHLMLNKNSPGTYIKTQHNQQKFLNKLHPTTFPTLQCHVEFDTQPTIPHGNMVQGFNGLQFVPGSRPLFSITDGLYANRNVTEITGKVSPAVLKHLQESTDTDQDYPEVVFLGTSSGVANWARNPSGILIQTRKDDYILLDCGEGTLLQLYQLYGSQAESVLTNLRAVFLSHLHYDHIGGLPSLIEARARATSKQGNRDKLCIIAPKIFLRWVSNFERYFGEMSSKLKVFPHETIVFDNRVGCEDKQIQQMKQSLCMKEITPVSVIHTETAYGTVLTHEDGWKLVYSGDCRPTMDLIKHGKGCDILIHEGTYRDNQAQQATFRKHSTTREAVEVAKEMEARFTLVTHLSSTKPIQETKYFSHPDFAHIAFAYDFMKIRRSTWEYIPHIKKAILHAQS